MLNHTPSATALKVAALRALHQTADAPAIFVDPFAERILGLDAAGILEAYRVKADETARLRATLAVRTVIADEAIAAAVARGATQCVILGAGLDTFAYRNAHTDLRIYEVDHPATQAWKRDLLHDADLAAPATVRYVAADFERDDLFTVLRDAGFDRRQPVVFVLIGVISYLESGTTLETLRRIGFECAGGADIVLDYTEPYHDAPAPIRAAYEAAARRVAAGGEPWVTVFAPEVLHAHLGRLGFSNIVDLDASALHQRFCAGRTDGLSIAPLVHLLRARI
jgi:methyltransferase (TIGR00027 family)